MKTLFLAAAAAFTLHAGTAFASADCDAKAAEKHLAGAAKTSFLKKCNADAKASCEEKAVDKNGKPLAGAAKASFVKKCVKGGK